MNPLLQKEVEAVCKYDSSSRAVFACKICKTGLCSFCGYIVNGKNYCNEDYPNTTQP